MSKYKCNTGSNNCNPTRTNPDQAMSYSARLTLVVNTSMAWRTRPRPGTKFDTGEVGFFFRIHNIKNNLENKRQSSVRRISQYVICMYLS